MDEDVQPGDFATFGRLLKDTRLAAGMSMRSLGAAAEVNPGSISHAENGEVQRRLSEDAVDRLDRGLKAGGALRRSYRRVLGRPVRYEDSAAGVDLLPPAPSPFAGREGLLQVLGESAGSRDAGSAAIVLSGPGGIGKTGLALRGAHQIKDRFAVAVSANLRGWDQSAGPRPIESVLRSWCRACDVPDAALGGDLDELIETWLRTSARQPVLAVADNALPWQVEALRPGHPDSLLIVTTRDRRLRLDAAEHLEVPPLDESESLALLTARTGWADRVVKPLVAPCGGAPLALCTAAAQAVAHWDEGTLGIMAHEFTVADEPDLEDRIARSSYERLSPDVQVAWRRWALIGGPLDEDQAAAVLAVPHTTARGWLHASRDAYLLRRGAGGYSYADLHRGFAIREAQRVDSADILNDAVRRGLTWLLHGHLQAAPLLAGRDDTPITPEPLEDGVIAPVHADRATAWAWVEAHWSYPQPVQAALDLGAHRLAWQLVAAGISAAYLIKPLNEWDRAARAVLNVLRDDPEGEAWMHQARGICAGDTGEAPRALSHFLRALEIRRELGAEHLRDVGWSALNAARWALATDAGDPEIEPLIREGLAAHEEISHPGGPTLGITLQATLAARRGDWDDAREQLAGAWSAAPQLGDPAITSFIGASYSDALLRVGERDDSERIARDTDQVAEEAGVDWGRIGALIALARATETREPLSLALGIAERIGDDRAETIRDSLTAEHQ